MAKHTENAAIELAARPKALGDAWWGPLHCDLVLGLRNLWSRTPVLRWPLDSAKEAST